MAEIDVWLPRKLGVLKEPHRYKVLYGGRGGIKSWTIAQLLLYMGAQRDLRIPCARETMQSIRFDLANTTNKKSNYTAITTCGVDRMNITGMTSKSLSLTQPAATSHSVRCRGMIGHHMLPMHSAPRR